MKIKKEYVCEGCEAKYPKWTGFCNQCKSWNSISEVNIADSFVGDGYLGSTPVRGNAINMLTLSEVHEDLSCVRYRSGIEEFDRVCGGGIVKGSVVLIGGEPGIGKSTLLLQVSSNLSKSVECLYFSGEESVTQIKVRYSRMQTKATNLKIATTNSMENILATVTGYMDNNKEIIVIIDSIQTLTNKTNDSFAGSVTQIRTSTQLLIDFAKTNGISIIIVGHVTKDGSIAGPKMLEHMVDAVLYMEGEKINNYRLLRAIKNRYGSSDEIGVFEMRLSGLKEMNNPSELFINRRSVAIPGVVTFVSMEGSRAMMIEIQSLLVDTNFPAPRRSVVGVDINRLYVVIAVLEAICGISLAHKDIYVSVVGGIKISDPAVDFAVAASILSFFKKQSVPSTCVIFGEVGLTGEIRNTTHASQRIKEANKLGFVRTITSDKHKDDGQDLILFQNIFKFYKEFFA